MLITLLKEKKEDLNPLMNMEIDIEEWKKKDGEKSNKGGKLSSKESGKRDLDNGVNIKIPKEEIVDTVAIGDTVEIQDITMVKDM